MRNELIQALTDITEINLIENMILNMNNKDLFHLMNLLEYTDEYTQKKWLNTYKELLMY